MPIPPGSLTRQQIRDLALNRAGNRALDPDAIAWLAQILFDLYTLYDWPFLNVSAVVTLGISFTLPTDFYQAQDDTALRPLTYGGQVLKGADPILELDRGTFDSRYDGTTFGQPLVWTADRANGLGLVFPVPATTCTAQLRYKRIPVEPATADEPTDVPVFPWSNFLVQALYVVALEHERDPRVSEAIAIRDQQFAMIRRGSSPRMAQAAVVPLDPTVFRRPFQGD